jgi:D-alanyl-D-alanine carboxypeptidase/D-alanyl-D-alanine-endopeptidase (penicillin-binding protein 4)
VVAALSDGKVVYRSGPATVTPASTNKLPTVTAALKVLGPQATFRTSVRLSADHRRVVLVGGGDPFLASSHAKARAHQPARADLGTLARLTAAKLQAQGLSRVRLAYDTSLFSGPQVNPAWPSAYVTEGVVPPITALWADEGAARKGSGYEADPALAAAQIFATALRKDGITVLGKPVHATAATGDAGLADVQSAPLGLIVEKTLETSDNNAAEVIGHQVGLAERQRGSFAAGVVAVRSVLRQLGVPTAGDRVYDASGLSRADRVSPLTLLGVLEAAARADQPELRQVLTGLPVAGFSGSLQERFQRSAPVARGRVRAKTGTLTGVSGLAGTATDRQGDELVFVAVADRVDVLDTLDARLVLDRLAASLAACRCGTTP